MLKQSTELLKLEETSLTKRDLSLEEIHRELWK
jgi:hypothetical protein